VTVQAVVSIQIIFHFTFSICHSAMFNQTRIDRPFIQRMATFTRARQKWKLKNGK